MHVINRAFVSGQTHQRGPSDDLEDDELAELIKMEARQFFEKLIKTPEGKAQFLNWLFHLAGACECSFAER